MPLPASPIARTPLHTRTICVNAFAREDGLLDVEAELKDVKAYDFPVSKGIHKAGQAIHHMWLRITVAQDYTITDAMAHDDAAPYGEHCKAITPQYRDLIGMNLLRGFRLAVKARFGRQAGCTHLSELAAVLPTAAIQARSGERRRTEQTDRDQKPFQLGSCHALRLDGAVVREFYPRWYATPSERSEAS